jgi:hypothetical protein
MMQNRFAGLALLFLTAVPIRAAAPSEAELLAGAPARIETC